MIKRLLTPWALCALLLAPGAQASERPSHYQGLPADTLEQAVQNFSEYNRKLADLLAREQLSAADLGTVHELTYTLENALEKIRSELESAAETLEEVHVASETGNTETVAGKGREYLSISTTVIE